MIEVEVLADPCENTNWQGCLQHWAWLLKDKPEFNTWLVTKFGELFVKINEEVWYLGTSGASYKKVANTEEDFFNLMDESEELDFYFMPQIIKKLEEAGLKLNKGECYGFKMPMVFKESTLEPDNFNIIDIEKYLIGLGDLLGKLQGTQNGEKVSFNVVS